jgi:hypothetical protein
MAEELSPTLDEVLPFRGAYQRPSDAPTSDVDFEHQSKTMTPIQQMACILSVSLPRFVRAYLFPLKYASFYTYLLNKSFLTLLPLILLSMF